MPSIQNWVVQLSLPDPKITRRRVRIWIAIKIYTIFLFFKFNEKPKLVCGPHQKIAQSFWVFGQHFEWHLLDTDTTHPHKADGPEFLYALETVFLRHVSMHWTNRYIDFPYQPIDLSLNIAENNGLRWLNLDAAIELKTKIWKNTSIFNLHYLSDFHSSLPRPRKTP